MQLLEGRADAEDGGFIEVAADNLHADGQAVGAGAEGDGEGG